MKTAINIRMEEELKKQGKEFAKSIGISLSALLTALLKQAVKERKVEFSSGTVNDCIESRRKYSCESKS
ncbi:type II toxin-antitoxin system antitoxin, RelB/DinJ family [Candidatus Peregrinibacteria bacterium]|nr:MAG: type II toxin-antitoxin system antitoxin, RelB/DinJ family [Candidatus Peregrinibacteria bacterium]